MSTLLAHHLEFHHVPILLAMFAAGFFAGWQLLGRCLGRGRGSAGEAPSSGPPGE